MTTEQKLLYEILGKLTEVDKKVEVNTVYQKIQEKRISKLESLTDDLITQKNISVGKKTVWTMVAGAVGAVITLLIKFLSHT